MLHSKLPTPPNSGVHPPGCGCGCPTAVRESRSLSGAPVPPGQEGANATSLGTPTKEFVGQGGSGERRFPSRYRLQRFAAGLAGDHKGLAVCGWKPMEGASGVAVRGKSKDGGGFEKVQLGNLAICGSHLCPVCGPRVAEVRRGEVAHILDWADGQRLHPVFLTLTTSSKKGQPLAPMVRAQKEALRIWKQDRRYKERRPSIVGVVSAFETTHGANGWHPHFHLLLLVKAKTMGRALRLVAGLRAVWVAAAKAQGLHAGRAGFKAQAGHRAAEYMAKWDLSDEVAAGVAKESKDKDKGKTPSQLLRRGYEGDKAASRLWGEYERAMRGKSVLRFSPGLRALAGVPDMTDQKAAEEGDGERPEEAPRVVLPLIDLLPCDLWAEAKRYGLDRDDLKRAAKEDGRAGIRAYLAELREVAAFHPIE
jgi:hypothetical protein